MKTLFLFVLLLCVWEATESKSLKAALHSVSARVRRESDDVTVRETPGPKDPFAIFHGGSDTEDEVDPHADHRNFLKVEPNGVYYTVRTGSNPSDRDGPIVAYYYSPYELRHQGGKFYVGNIPFYF
ncbi:uncharacterized protein LOC106459549 [Limulus polyphemus]|uniref:Uncharacterized protein LOC106459549 n=1 Tax=Limulus polyphemus TaxID=6850 RepID=A0ABM1B4G8_LIMPO|nr:uncharacterized protein LOC106459549 [Limulus polyphemus]